MDVVADWPLKVEAVGDIELDSDGKFDFKSTTSEDFGIIGGWAWVWLNLPEVDRRRGLATSPSTRLDIEMQLPLASVVDCLNSIEILTEDLSKHVWAHLPVLIVLEVEDLHGQIGQSVSLEIKLPARSFFDPLAKALIEQRRDLLWPEGNFWRVAQILRAISQQPA